MRTPNRALCNKERSESPLTRRIIKKEAFSEMVHELQKLDKFSLFANTEPTKIQVLMNKMGKLNFLSHFEMTEKEVSQAMDSLTLEPLKMMSKSALLFSISKSRI